NGYPSGGNYWSDYIGIDLYSGPNQDQPGSDGIGDAPYTFYGGQDNYPFMVENGWEVPEKWSFAIITDLHIGWGIPDYDTESYSDGEIGQDYYLTERLKKIIEWINNNHKNPDYNIKFVAVTGDISDTAEYSEFLTARKILNELEIPYIPIIGNHDIWPYVQKITTKPDNRIMGVQDKKKDGEPLGDEYFETVFWKENSTNTQKIKSLFGETGLIRQEEQVGYEGPPYFQNYAFSYGGTNFISLDFASRDFWKLLGLPINSELQENTTLKWFKEKLKNHGGGKVVVFTHYPFRIIGEGEFKLTGGFWPWDRENISDVIRDCNCEVFNFAGHTHINATTSPGEEYEVTETEPTSQIPLYPNYTLTGEFIRVVQINGDNVKEINYETLIGGFPSAINPYFTVSPGEVSTGHEITFKAYAKNRKPEEISHYKWEFGDGPTITTWDNEFKKIYQNPGTYKVSLTVIDIYGNSEELSWNLQVKAEFKKPFKIFLPVPGLIPLLSGEEGINLTQQANAQNTKEWVIITQVTSPAKLVGGFKVHFEQATEDVDLSNLVADIDLETKKSILYMSSWPILIEEEKILYIPHSATGTVYVCPNATSLQEVNPQCSGKITLQLGEITNGLFLSTTIYEDNDYYIIFGFTNGGGGVNLPPVAGADGPYQGYGGLPITFDASSSTDPNNDPLQYRWDFDNDGIWDTNWLNASTAEHIWNNDYEGVVKLEVNDGEFTATATTSVKVISPKTFKEEAIVKLKSAKTGKWIIDRMIDWIIQQIQDSLNQDLWIDASHLIFFKKGICIDSKIFEIHPDKIGLEEIFGLEIYEAELKLKEIFKEECFPPKTGLIVFFKEYKAVVSMSLSLKLWRRMPGELKLAFQEAIAKLLETDQLLAQVSLYDAKNTPVSNPGFQEIVEYQIAKAEEELIKAEQELAGDHPGRAIVKSAKSWLHSQLAIKFASFKMEL
ncbi:MAG: PKD domain-containing protein, partial [Candidatus Aminicenantia bacterium]